MPGGSGGTKEKRNFFHLVKMHCDVNFLKFSDTLEDTSAAPSSCCVPPAAANRFWRMNGLLEGRMLLRDFARNYIVKSPHLVLLFPTALTTPES